MAISLIQSKSSKGIGVTSVSCTFTSTPATGSSVFAQTSSWVRAWGSSSVADNKGNTYTMRQNPGNTNPKLGMYDNLSGTRSATFTITGTPGGSGGQDMDIAISEWSGVTGGYDQGTSQTGTSGTYDTGSAPTTTQNDELLLVAFTSEGTSGTTTLSAGYTKLQEIVTTANMPICVGYQVVSVTGHYGATLSANAQPWAAAIATYKGTSSGSSVVGSVDMVGHSAAAVIGSDAKRGTATAVGLATVSGNGRELRPGAPGSQGRGTGAVSGASARRGTSDIIGRSTVSTSGRRQEPGSIQSKGQAGVPVTPSLARTGTAIARGQAVSNVGGNVGATSTATSIGRASMFLRGDVLERALSAMFGHATVMVTGQTTGGAIVLGYVESAGHGAMGLVAGVTRRANSAVKGQAAAAVQSSVRELAASVSRGSTYFSGVASLLEAATANAVGRSSVSLSVSQTHGTNMVSAGHAVFTSLRRLLVSGLPVSRGLAQFTGTPVAHIIGKPAAAGHATVVITGLLIGSFRDVAPERCYVILHENRVYTITENRIYVITPENRVYTVED